LVSTCTTCPNIKKSAFATERIYEFLRIRGINEIKSKAVPLQAWSGPEGSRKLRFPDFLITARDGGKVVSLTHQSYLPPGNNPGIHFC
jgi:hypothetical protein